MAAIIQNNLRVSAAKKFVSKVGQTNNVIYAFLGKSIPWDNENSPPLPLDWVQSTIDAYDDMLYLKRVIPNDVSQVIRRFDWQRNYIYETYTHNQVLFDPARGVLPFYVVTDEGNVYKCINNAFGKPSRNKPTGRSANIFSSGDGYLWKYMYTVTVDLDKFSSNEFIPVKSTGSVGAKDYGIEHIKIINAGSGYTGSTVSLTISGTGANCAAYGVVVNGKITEVVITNRGSGYRSASVAVPAPPTGGTQAVLSAIISPPGGHGSNPPLELGGHFVTLIARFIRDEDSKFSVTNDFRKIGLIENPKDYLLNTPLTTDALSQTQNLKFSSIIGTGFTLDEVVTGSISGHSGRVVDYASDTQILRLSNVTGNFYPGEQLIGDSSDTQGYLDIGTGATGTAQGGGINTITLANSAPVDINLTGFSTVIRITSGKGVGQVKVVSSYDPNTKTATILDYWDYTLVPDNTSHYVLAWIKYADIALDSGDLLFVEHRRPNSRAIEQIEECKITIEF